jgi:hypothetical protein
MGENMKVYCFPTLKHTMKNLFILLFSMLVFTSCDWAKDKAKSTLHKGGEVVGKAGSEVVDGLTEGVEESFSNLIEVSPSIKAKGLQTGQIKVSGTNSSTDNIVSVYMVFNKSYAGSITAKAIDKNGLEFGRTTLQLSGDSGQARFVDFIFDKRTNLDRKDKVVLE